MTRAWVGVVSRAHVLRGVEGGFAQLCHGKRLPLEKMSVGDWLVYYSPRTEMRGGEPLRAFTALGRVHGARTVPFDMGGGFVPYRRDVRFERAAREVPLARLGQSLDFIRSNPHWGMLARRGHFEISLEDLRTIAAAMGVSAEAFAPAPTPHAGGCPMR
ncbi:EVE domain-containing protein [Archangium lipolyticum]|uniref:EVE domain-containing protein n=1 Tax=Archangium lipolyticum TaxID=2970465 RepID=UPI00214AC075|nr:EVE domain-containing protein [Archangium lipolyticum]